MAITIIPRSWRDMGEKKKERTMEKKMKKKEENLKEKNDNKDKEKKSSVASLLLRFVFLVSPKKKTRTPAPGTDEPVKAKKKSFFKKIFKKTERKDIKKPSRNLQNEEEEADHHRPTTVFSYSSTTPTYCTVVTPGPELLKDQKRSFFRKIFKKTERKDDKKPSGDLQVVEEEEEHHRPTTDVFTYSTATPNYCTVVTPGPEPLKDQVLSETPTQESSCGLQTSNPHPTTIVTYSSTPTCSTVTPGPEPLKEYSWAPQVEDGETSFINNCRGDQALSEPTEEPSCNLLTYNPLPTTVFTYSTPVYHQVVIPELESLKEYTWTPQRVEEAAEPPQTNKWRCCDHVVINMENLVPLRAMCRTRWKVMAVSIPIALASIISYITFYLVLK